MDYNLSLPSNKRYKFAEPLDKLISGTREETLLKIEKIFKGYIKSHSSINTFLVGDIVTKDFLNNTFLKSFVKLCIIDEKTKRNRILLESKDFFEKTYELKNPVGTINKDSWFLLESVVSTEEKTLIKIIEGEEDLLVLPLILALPIQKNAKNIVFYGQPPITDAKITIPEGIVLVEVTDKIQEKVRKLLDLMDKS